MKIKSPKSIVSRPNAKRKTAKIQASPPSQTNRTRLNHLKQKRRKLRAAENVTKDPLKGHLKQRGQLVGRRIGNLQNENKKSKQ